MMSLIVIAFAGFAVGSVWVAWIGPKIQTLYERRGLRTVTVPNDYPFKATLIFALVGLVRLLLSDGTTRDRLWGNVVGLLALAVGSWIGSRTVEDSHSHWSG